MRSDEDDRRDHVERLTAGEPISAGSPVRLGNDGKVRRACRVNVIKVADLPGANPVRGRLAAEAYEVDYARRLAREAQDVKLSDRYSPDGGYGMGC